VKKLIFHFLACAAPFWTLSAADIPLRDSGLVQLVVPEADSPPDWNEAAEIKTFYRAYPAAPSAYPVSVKLLYDDPELLIKAEMSGEKESGMPASPAEPEKCEFMWADSCLNFYIDPERSNFDVYYHFVNSKGLRFQFGPDVAKGWKSDWTANTHRDEMEGKWGVSIHCNLKAMGGKAPSPGSVWGINFNRHTGGAGGRIIEASGWPLNHYKPADKYAALIFGPLSERKIRIESAALTQDSERNFTLKLKTSPAAKDLSAQIKISSRGKAAGTVFSGPAATNIPFEWSRTKDGEHTLDIILRDKKGLVAGMAEYVFSLSSPPSPVTDKPMLWPEPAEWRSLDGYWIMPEKLTIYLDKKHDDFPAHLLAQTLFKKYGLLCVDLIKYEQKSGKGLIQLDYSGPPEEFGLSVSRDFVRIRSGSPRFMYYGVRAFIDLVCLSSADGPEARAKCGEIHDKPGVKRRVFMLYPEMGLAENVKPEISELKDLIFDQVAGGRYDTLILMIKGSMRYDSHPELLNNPEYKGKYYTKAEIKELIDYARQHYLEVIPGCDSPGHSEWLAAPCPELREDGSAEVVCTRNPKTMKILKDCYSELLKLFAPCDYLFISGGEIFYSTALVPEEKRCRLCHNADKGTLLLEHWRQLNDFCAQKKVKPIIWSDMISPSWNGGGRWKTAEIFNSLPRDFTIVSWDPGDTRTVRPWEIIEKGFPPPWRITTVFAERQYDTFLKTYKLYAAQGIAEDYPFLWCNFQSGPVETSCGYTTPAIHLFADCAWNPSAAAGDYFSRINSRGPYWCRQMNTPKWGARKLDWTPVSLEAARNSKAPELPAKALSVGGIPFDLGDRDLNTVSVTGKAARSEPVKIGRKVWGMAFLHCLSGNKDVRNKLHKCFKEENRDQRGITAAFIRITYEDGNEVSAPLVLGWHTHFKDCWPPARVMPGADFYWTVPGEKQKLTDPNFPDLCWWMSTWRNPHPNTAVKEISIQGNSDAEAILAGAATAEVSPR
jgi:hypothetical protein